MIPRSTFLLLGGGEFLQVITSQSADAQFLRRVLIGLVILTLVTGFVAAYTTVNAMLARIPAKWNHFAEKDSR